ncbi:MAG TPA: DUF4031 domain-containing protein [Gemmatimonadales bacterium]
MTEPGWRYFGTREVLLARSWATSGGIAVHENLFRLRGHRTAHLLAPTEELLLAAARSIGCQDEWIQRTGTVHFDLILEVLERALRNCGVDPARPPVRRVWSDQGRV